MTTIKATIKHRRLELDVPSDWPDGIEVEIQPLQQLSTTGNAEALSPDEIARTLAAMDLIEPLEMTDAERSAWEARRQARKVRDKAEFDARGEELRRVWQ